MTTTGHRLEKPVDHVVGKQSRNVESLVARALTGGDRHLGARNAEGLGEELEDRRVGSPVDRGRRDADAHGAVGG